MAASCNGAADGKNKGPPRGAWREIAGRNEQEVKKGVGNARQRLRGRCRTRTLCTRLLGKAHAILPSWRRLQGNVMKEPHRRKDLS